jgi:hypothetical protein
MTPLSTFHLGQQPGALLGAELFHTCGDGGLVAGVGKNSRGNSSRV